MRDLTYKDRAGLSRYEPARAPARRSPRGIPNSSYAAYMGAAGMGDSTQGPEALEIAMQGRLRGLKMQAQIPHAESEADRLSEGVRATTPEGVKAEMGRRMGADFSSVRFHTDKLSAAGSAAIGARAYTTGRDVFFGVGGFDSSIAAHELVHTAQQGSVDSGAQVASTPAGGVQMTLWDKAKNFF